ncbi:unnamed protein product, partial [Closterium sp. NIES-54]
DLAEFLAANQVHVVASLPCYSADNVNKQRGGGVFDLSIKALQLLNSLGYGKEGSGLVLDLVYNPVGPFLPPAQGKLEEAYKPCWAVPPPCSRQAGGGIQGEMGDLIKLIKSAVIGAWGIALGL